MVGYWSWVQAHVTTMAVYWLMIILVAFIDWLMVEESWLMIPVFIVVKKTNSTNKEPNLTFGIAGG